MGSRPGWLALSWLYSLTELLEELLEAVVGAGQWGRVARSFRRLAGRDLGSGSTGRMATTGLFQLSSTPVVPPLVAF